ncbi:MAG: sulfatase [Myxococcota bacterium]
MTRLQLFVQRALALLLVALAGAACGGRGSAVPNVLLISIDTLRPDHLSGYGYGRETSPAIDALAREGVLFRDASSTSPWTLPAHVSMLTGRYPSRHGVVDRNKALSADVPTLATRLGAAGYDSMAIVNAYYVSRRYGLDQGFAHFAVLSEWSNDRGPKRTIVNRGEEITDGAMDWLRGRGERPFFLFLHYYDVHTDLTPKPEYRAKFVRPYEGRIDGSTRQLIGLRSAGVQLPPADLRHLKDLYDAEIRQLDDQIARLMAFLDHKDLADDTLVVLTSDHGEEFLEHGSLLHSRTHYQELIAIPLILRGPGVPRGRIVEEPVSLVDLVPTILSLTGLQPHAGMDGLDLSALWSGGALEARALYSEADDTNEVPDMKRMIRLDRHKLCYDRVSQESELYDLAEDAGEKNDLSAEDPERARRLLERLRVHMATEKSAEALPELTPQEVELLHQLGYGADR